MDDTAIDQMIQSSGIKPSTGRVGDTSWFKPYQETPKETPKPIPGTETAWMPAGELGQQGNLLKIIPNALMDAWNLVKGGTWETGKKVLQIPSETVGLAKDLSKISPGEALKAVGGGVGEGTAGVIRNLIPQSVKELFNTEGITEDPKTVMQVYLRNLDRARQAIENHPLTEGLGLAGLSEVTTRPIQTAKTAGEALKETGRMVTSPKETLTAAKEKVFGAPQPSTQLQEMVSSKVTAKQAMKEGRLIRGKETALFGKEPDTVIPKTDSGRIANMIEERIPNAQNMSDAELYNAMGDHIIELSKGLESEMEKAPVFEDTLQGAVNSWEELKTKQAETPDFHDMLGSKKFQENFENRLNQVSTDSNMKDIWKTAIDYDKSIPENVKRATPDSPQPGTWFRKQMWLQNRAVLRDIINKSADGLKETSQKAFKDMTDLYQTQEAINAKAPKLDVTGKPGIIPTTKAGLIKAGAAGLGAGLGIDWLAKKLGIF